MPFLTDLICEDCNFIWETILRSREEVSLEKCPHCGANFPRAIPGGNPTICHDPKVRSEILKKRSKDHSMKELRKNPDKYGFRTK